MSSFFLRWILSFWVKVKVLPKDASWLEVFKGKKVCYVTRSDVFSKHIVLEQVCRDVSMPLPSGGLQVGALTKPAAIFTLGRIKDHYADPAPVYLTQLLDAVKVSGEGVLLVPVSIFWGRGPKKSESMLGALFADEGSNSNIFSRFLSILFNGRQTVLRFGDPVSLKDYLESKQETQFLTRKLTRVLRVHFARTRLATVGPDQPSPKKIANKIIKADIVQQAIGREVSRKKVSRAEAEKQAKVYALEIAAVINIRAAIVLEKILGRLWNKLYDGIVLHHFSRVERLSREHQIVYVPSHQSHMDYLVLSYVLFNRGLAPPHVAAGINLNIPIVGPWIRRCGAFFLRRTFKGNILYGAVFEAYMGYLANKGAAVEYFVEGGRSRTGRKLKAKPGLLAMSVRSYLRERKRSAVFLPVNFSYEKLVEGETYANELSGKPKKSESVKGLLRSFKALKGHFGQVHVNFGSPIHLDQLIEAECPSWRNENAVANKKLVTTVVNNLGEKIMSGINEVTHVNAVALLAMTLLNAPDQKMDEEMLNKQLEIYLTLLEAVPYSNNVTRVDLNAADIVSYGEEFGALKRQSSEGVDQLFIESGDAVLMTYFRNNIIHLFALPSFIACCFVSNESVTKKQLVRWFRLVYPFLKSELSMRWGNRQLASAANKVITNFIDQGLIVESKGLLRVGRGNQEVMDGLSGGVSLSLERFYLTVLILQHEGGGNLTRFELEKICANTAEKLSEIKGLNSPEFFDKTLFKGFIEVLHNENIIWANDKGKLTYGDVLESIINDAGLVMSQQVRSNVREMLD